MFSIMASINIIFALRPISKAAERVRQDWRNARMVQYVFFDDDRQTSEKCLVFSLDRAPKVGAAYAIGRNDKADVILTDPESSGRHCSIAISNRGVPTLLEQSTNGTFVDGVCRNNDTIEIRHGMRIGIREALFHVWMPWRGQGQEEYEYNARRAREKRANTPVAFQACALPEPSQTAMVQKLGHYELTKITLSARPRTRLEVVRRGGSFFIGKWFTRPKDDSRDIQVWEWMGHNDKSHVSQVSDLSLLQDPSADNSIVKHCRARRDHRA